MQQTYDARNADISYWVNGVLRHRDEPGISPFDAAVQGGDAVWEGLRVYDGRVYALDAHLARLRRSAQALAFADIPTDAEMTAAVRETLRANGMTDGVHVRLTLTRGVKITSGMDPRLNQSGSTLIVLAEHKAPVYATTGLRLITASTQRAGPDVLDPKIHHANLLTSILAKIEANVAGADDALMLDGRGFVAETNATHIFAVIGGALVTSYTVACPEGITRATILDTLAPANDITAIERDISLTEIYTAEEVFCTGTMGEIAGVIEVDGRPIGDGAIGAMTRRVAELYRDHARANGTSVAGDGDHV